MADENMQSVIDAVNCGVDASRRVITPVEGVPLAILPEGFTAVPLDAALKIADARAPAPRRTRGTAKHAEVDSFIAHVNLFKRPSTRVFADVDAETLTAVLNYAAADAPAWGDHRSVYSCPKSRQWKLWTGMSGQALTPDQFAQFIDDNSLDITKADPNGPISEAATPSQLATMARQLFIEKTGTFKRIVNPTTGAMEMEVKDDNGPTSTPIHRTFVIQIPVFEGGAEVQIEARIRFNLNQGRPVFAFLLMETDRILRDTFAAVRAKVASETDVVVFAGTPEA